LESRQLQVLWRYRWSLAAFVVVTVVAAIALTLWQEKTYEATARVRLIPSQQLTDSPLPDATGLERFTETYAELARSTPVVNDAARRTDSDVSAATLKGSIDVTSQRSGVLIIKASAQTGRRAARYANALAGAFVRRVAMAGQADRRSTVGAISGRIRLLRSELNRVNSLSGDSRALVMELQQLSSRLADSQARPVDQARVIDSAESPTSPSSPKPVRNGLLAFVFALITGSGLVYLHYSVSDRFGSAEEASNDLDLPLLGVLPKANPDDLAALDAFRVLRINSEFAVQRIEKRPASSTKALASESSAGARLGQDVRSGITGGLPGRTQQLERDAPSDGLILLVISPEENTGKTYVTTNLAYAFAADGERVVVVEGDLRRPALHQRYNIPLEPGVTDFLAGITDFSAGARKNGLVTTRVWLSADVARRGGELDALTAGQPRADSSEMLSNRRMVELVERMRQDFGVAVVDGPPTASVPDAALLTRYADGVILVIDSRRTRRRTAMGAVQALRWLEAPLLGIAFNRVSMRASYHGYGYGHSRAGRRRPSPNPDAKEIASKPASSSAS
jgi:capsular exopolysaccharide synthesis family protein